MNSKGLILTVALIGALALACSSSPDGSEDATEKVPVTACAEPRPELCTMEYIPVCGHHYSGERKTYSNACAACSDPDVSGRRPGPCEEPEAPAMEPETGR
jgi:hypothetical protein